MRTFINLWNMARTVIKGKHISLSKSILKTTAQKKGKRKRKKKRRKERTKAMPVQFCVENTKEGKGLSPGRALNLTHGDSLASLVV